MISYLTHFGHNLCDASNILACYFNYALFIYCKICILNFEFEIKNSSRTVASAIHYAMQLGYGHATEHQCLSEMFRPIVCR